MKPMERILRAVYSAVWAIQPEKLEAIIGFLQMRAQGGSASADTIADIRAANEISAARAQKVSTAAAGSVAVLPLYGLITQRTSFAGDFSGPGGTSVQSFTQQFREAVNDPNVKAIVIDVDSPGGDVSGVDELATEIYNARKQKKVTAVSNCLMASAAYYLACSATEIVASPSSLTGSIGVYSAHEDYSQADEKAGVKVTLISAGKYKTEGNMYEPLSDDARSAMQALVDSFYGKFVKAVARGRGVSQAAVREGFGQGRVLTAEDAVKFKLADRVATLDEVLSGYGVKAPGPAASAAVQVSVPSAADEDQVVVQAAAEVSDLPVVDSDEVLAAIASDQRSRSLRLATL